MLTPPFPPVDEHEDVSPPEPELVVTEPEVLAYLLGPDGEPIATLLSRRPVEFGFHP